MNRSLAGADEGDFPLKNYDYFLPPDAVALYPATIKDECKLLVMNRNPHEDKGDQPYLVDDIFRNIAHYLPKNALLVANNSKVLPARIQSKRKGGGKLEFLLLTPLPLVVSSAEKQAEWQSSEIDCLLRPAAKIKPGQFLELTPNLMLKVQEKGEFGRYRAILQWRGKLEEIFTSSGTLPLPPYIKREVESGDTLNYQTIYAKKTGSVAAPTAGLHFTDSLRQNLLNQGIGWLEATLYVGYGTFSPVRCEDIRSHKMHSEYVELPAETAKAITMAKKEGRPIVAVGTTSLRILEGVWEKLGAIEEWSGWTDIFLYPGKTINVVDGLITNFHLPRSTLLMLVAAFAGRKRILQAYEEAVARGYRFFSYGDAMLII